MRRLRATEPIYRDLRCESLIELIDAGPAGDGYAMAFRWAEGRCMSRMYEDDHRLIMALPVGEKLAMFREIAAFLALVARRGYVAIDFYDGSILYDPAAKRLSICDIDFFRRTPCVNDMGRMWGSPRFISPEECAFGAPIDEVTNVFTLGQMAFSLFTDSNRRPDAWPLSPASHVVLLRAIDPAREKRFPTIEAFSRAWEAAFSL